MGDDVKEIWTKTRPCEACAFPHAKLRRCTNQVLCLFCRKKPQYRLISKNAAQEQFNLQASELDGLVYYEAYNAINPAKPMKMFKHTEVRARANSLRSLARPPLKAGYASNMLV